jgi:D-alanyl-D-alanine-carboxypeptidase/D-alanyl-D-alanine-endopeptidase
MRHTTNGGSRLAPGLALGLALGLGLGPGPATAQDPLRPDPLLQEAVEFTGAIAFLGGDAPAMLLTAVRADGATAFAGFGEIAPGSGAAPAADTILRIGSISKVLCGATLASLVAQGDIALTDRAQDRLGYPVTLPERDGRAIRIIDLATHAAGLPREVPRPDAPADDPFASNTREAQIAALAADPLLFAPGTGAFYSNFGFDLLGAALGNTAGKPYPELLAERVLTPLGMKDTALNPPDSERARMMQGHDFDGSPMPFVPTPETIGCAGGLHATAADMQRWIAWHLDRDGADAETRLIDHAAWRYRDGLDPVAGLDDAGTAMDAIGLGWVIMLPEGDRPLILQKSGGLQGTFSYLAIAPGRGIGVFAAINRFSLGGFDAMVHAVNALVTSLAPR